MDQTPTVPARFRTVCYVLGALFGLGVAPAMLSLDLPQWAGVAAAAAGAANALAFGYRPTRTDGGT